VGNGALWDCPLPVAFASLGHTHTFRFNDHFPDKPGLAGCPIDYWFSFSIC